MILLHMQYLLILVNWVILFYFFFQVVHVSHYFNQKKAW